MEELKALLEKYLNENLELITLSAPRKGREELKARIRPVLLRDELKFQLEIFRGPKAFHENLPREEAVERIVELLTDVFCQLQLQADAGQVTALVSKKGKVTVKEKRQPGKAGNAGVKPTSLAHNKKKRYLLEEGRPVPFLVDLGVMTPEGRIVHARYDKFRQINRFLEFVEDILPALPKNRELTILDFGCGKSYLTFAIYYYLRECQGLDVRIIGLDLKEDVIRKCGELSRKYGYDKLTFLQGDIAGYEGCSRVDMVVTLHACDTATDYALYKAVKWGASVILSVPCCQHELNKQLENETLAPILKYGLLKERMAALMTGGLRAELLEQQGYETQILEFIDMEHTPKNILIRAVRRKNEKKADTASAASFDACTEALHADLTLEKLLNAGTSPAESYRSRRKNTENVKGESR